MGALYHVGALGARSSGRRWICKVFGVRQATHLQREAGWGRAADLQMGEEDVAGMIGERMNK